MESPDTTRDERAPDAPETDGGNDTSATREAAGVDQQVVEHSRPAVDQVEEALKGVPDSPTSATVEENSELEHTEGGTTTRQDALDQGVPMVQGDPSERQGPEDAIGVGPKRGDYESRVEEKIHETQRIDGGTGSRGPLRANDDGGIDRAPHTAVVPQQPRVEDVGEVPGLKGGVETAGETAVDGEE